MSSVQLNVRVSGELLERVRAAAGPRGVSEFVRAALEAKLEVTSVGPGRDALGLVPGSRAWYEARRRVV